MKRSQRKKILVDRRIQGALVRRVMIHWIVFFCFTAVMFVFLRALLDDPSLTLQERLENRVGDLFLLGLLVVCLLPSFMLDTIRFSNRFVGPITRLKGVLKRFAQTGTAERIAFRKDDFWQEIADDFNQLVERVERQRQATGEVRATSPEEPLPVDSTELQVASSPAEPSVS